MVNYLYNVPYNIGNMEPWAKDWLEEQHKAGEKCLEIKVRDNCHYVYHSTSRYDKEIKKGRKVSVYLGRLDKVHGFIPKGEKPKANKASIPRSVTDFGNSIILRNAMAEIKPLLMISSLIIGKNSMQCQLFVLMVILLLRESKIVGKISMILKV